MHRPGSPLAFATFLALSLAAAPGLVAQDDAAADIAAVNAALTAAVAAGDAAAGAALYTADAMFLGPNAPAVTGRDEVQAMLQGMIDAGIGRIALTTDELVVLGGMAHEVGRYVLDAADGTHLDHGKYIVIWRNTADGWRLHRDIINSDMPAATGGH
jgi:uncharacterized protein (TIGR02246 family)